MTSDSGFDRAQRAYDNATPEDGLSRCDTCGYPFDSEWCDCDDGPDPDDARDRMIDAQMVD